MNRDRSLHIEHVSPARLMKQEISRRTSSGSKSAGDPTLALMRRWFWARKPDAGFILTDFPATLLQALVFDEWLETRQESLDAVFATDAASLAGPVAEHYRNLGLLAETATPISLA